MTLLVGRQEGHPACKKTEWWSAGVVIYLERGADLHTAQLMPLPLTVSCSVKSRLALPFWYQLTRVVPDKGPLNGYMWFKDSVAPTLAVSSAILNIFHETEDLPVVFRIVFHIITVHMFSAVNF